MNRTLDRERAAALKEMVSAQNRRERLQQWVREEKILPVAEVPIDWVRFSTINHRIRAQQMRESVIQGNPNLYLEDPLGEEAQQSTYILLSQIRDFNELKEDLRKRGQVDLAVVTADGVLINGNRRAAALRTLWQKNRYDRARYIRCMVLPEDATPEEILDLETELQVAKEFREKYTWVNEALMIEDLYKKSNNNFETVANQMRENVSYVRRKYDMIQHVRKIVTKSKGNRDYTEFENKETHFDELITRIQKISAAEMDQIVNACYICIISNVDVKTMRKINKKGIVDYICEELKYFPKLNEASGLEENQEEVESATRPDDTDSVHSDENARKLERFLNVLATTTRGKSIILPSGKEVTGVELQRYARVTIESAIEEAEEAEKFEASSKILIGKLDNAIKNIELAKRLLRPATHQEGWNNEKFKRKMEEAYSALNTLRDEEAQIWHRDETKGER